MPKVDMPPIVNDPKRGRTMIVKCFAWVKGDNLLHVCVPDNVILEGLKNAKDSEEIETTMCELYVYLDPSVEMNHRWQLFPNKEPNIKYKS